MRDKEMMDKIMRDKESSYNTGTATASYGTITYENMPKFEMFSFPIHGHSNNNSLVISDLI